jgi:hypothetical protein
MLCKIYPLAPGDTIPTENTKMNRLDFTDSYDYEKAANAD